MVFLTTLWLPILLSAVMVFIASSVIHMVLPIHKGDYAKLPNEDEALADLRKHGISPGQYHFPRVNSMKEMGEDHMIKKFNDGPVGFMVVLPNGPMAMGKSLIAWFLYSLLIGIFVAYLAHFSLQPGTDYLTVFRVTGTMAVLGYAFASIPESIWKGASWSSTFKFVFDGVVYGLVTAGCFAWLWPEA